MSVVYVIGVDPGPSTGVLVTRNGVKIAALQGPHESVLVRLGALLATITTGSVNNVVTIACERFVATGQRGPRTHQPVPQRVIGQVEQLATSFSCDLVLQSPADAKRVAPTQLLRDLGLYVTRDEVGQPDANDVNDAARHAVLCLARQHAALFDHLLTSRP